MPDLEIDIADWGVKEVVNKALAGLITDGTLPAAEEPALDAAAETITNAVLAIVAAKIGVA